MHRRAFLHRCAAAGLVALSPTLAVAGGDSRRLLVLVELKGGNDGLNTVVPYADPRYAELRPRLAMRPDEVLQLDAATGLHPALAPLMPLWQKKELAVVDSVGYPQPNLSHFRSIEIWDTGSRADETLQTGWLARALARRAVPADYLAEGVAIGNNELGPLAGARAISLKNAGQFTKQSRLAQDMPAQGNAALRRVMQVESEIAGAGKRLGQGLENAYAFRTEFPRGEFGQTVHTAAQVVAAGPVAVLRLTLGGFDTHQNQANTQANLLGQLADGLVALRGALEELGRWPDTLVMTYAEFGRRPKANASNGTDHGTASAHFVLGGRVRGGLYGAPPALNRLDGNGNLPFAVDFRQLYATVLERWWDQPAGDILGGFTGRPLPLV